MKHSVFKIFTAAALALMTAGCESRIERAAEADRATKLARETCPPSMPVDADRMLVIFNDKALKAAHLKTLNDAGMGICLDRAMPKAKKPVYGHGPFAIFQPATKDRGPILRLWDDGQPPVYNAIFQAKNGFNRYSHQAIQGAAEIIEGKKYNMKPDKLSIATDSFGCNSHGKCFGIFWEPAENHKEVIAQNPDLFPGGLQSTPAAAPK